MIPRALYKSIQDRLFKGKAILIIGPRQSGKTTLLRRMAADYADQHLFLNCDKPNVRRRLQEASSSALHNLIGPARMLFIKEAFLANIFTSLPGI